MIKSGGEGAVSTGPLVPVHRGRSEADARAVASLLEAQEIPALLDSELADVVLPFVPASSRRALAPQVLVPRAFARSARQVLSRHEGRLILELARTMSSSPGRVRAVRARSVAGPPPPSAKLEPEVVSEAVETLPDEPLLPIDQEEPAPFVLPEPPPLIGRLSLAFAAIAVGLFGQHLLTLRLGDDGVRALFGARAPLLDEPWRLVTASFLHGSISHVLSNAVFGLLIGVVLFGTHRFGAAALVWLLSSAVGLVAESVFSPAAIIIGASAGNYGLVGLWAKGQVERSKLSLFPRRERLRTLGLLLLLIPGALTPFSSTGTRIAVLAHAAGFVAGFLCGYFFHRRLIWDEFPRIDRRARWAGRLALGTIGTGWSLAALSLFR